MKTIVDKFAQCLTEIKYPTKKEHWNIGGVLKKRSNQYLKFDVRNMFNLPNGLLGKKGRTSSNADKMVFETENAWLILDIPEICRYVKKHRLKIVYLEKLMTELEWNISIPK